MQAVAGGAFSSTLIAPAGLDGRVLGARIEVPVTRAIVAAFQVATRLGAVFTVTIDAPATPGDYQLVWRTTDGDPPWFEAMVPLLVSTTGPSGVPLDQVDDLKCTVADVSALLWDRTNQDGQDTPAGFDTSTNPTAAQVQTLITLAAQDLAMRVGVHMRDELFAAAKTLVALQTATLVEASFFPGDLDGDRSAYEQYSAMYLAGVTALTSDARAPSGLRLR